MATENSSPDAEVLSTPRTNEPAPVGASMIPVINKLQNIFAQLGVTSNFGLPQVAVVGSQSSGKSSVLEALVGRDFLPRGPDICTRRPLVLQLVQLARHDGAPSPAEWGEFGHRPGERFDDFDDIRREIEAETERVAGKDKGVSSEQILLTIFSPNVLDLTLVDLPGITKVPIGSQPTDIEFRIRDMILSYINHKTCIILAVSPANSDLANSDALKMAMIADPDGSRTVGVITKLDLMDKGTDARKYLLGELIPLSLGYIGVVNRSKHDIDMKRSIKEALAHEEEFFRNNFVYHSISDHCGIPQLARKLNQILVQHIKMNLPGLKARLNAQMAVLVKELQSYGDIGKSNEEQRVVLLNILFKYSEAFSSMIEGKYPEMSTKELSGGARINYIFQKIFVKKLEEIDSCEDLTDDDIRMAIHNAAGVKAALFVPEVPFEILLRRQIARLLDPSLQCLRLVYDELIKISHACQSIDLHRFPALGKRLEEVLSKFLRNAKKPAERMIINIIEMEMDYINTSHSGFIGGSKATELASQRMRSRSLAASTARKSKDGTDNEKFTMIERGQTSEGHFFRSSANGLSSEQSNWFPTTAADNQTSTSGRQSSGLWGFSSIFGGSERQNPHKTIASQLLNEHIPSEAAFSMIQLKEPPPVLKTSSEQTENELLEISVTRLLLKSYYDIVRKNVQDSVPKAIMHFLVNHARRGLFSTFIEKMYRDELLSFLLSEREEVAVERQHALDMYHVLQQAILTLDGLPLDLDEVSNSKSGVDITARLASQSRPSISGNMAENGDANLSYSRTSSSRNPRKHKSTTGVQVPSAANGSPDIQSQ